MPCANKTKQLLAVSIKELMATTPLERLSVSDIVGRAGMGRNTFYYHFQDKYDLVNWIFETEAVPLVPLDSVSEDNVEAIIGELIDYLRRNREFYRNALSYLGQNCLQDYIYDTIVRMSLCISMSVPPEKQPSEEAARIDAELTACAFLGVLVRWTREGMLYDAHCFYSCARRIIRTHDIDVVCPEKKPAPARPMHNT